METCDGSQWIVRAALLSVSCDIPASCKVCGFTGHSAYHGCSQCLVEFPTETFGDKPDYSNFDRKTWQKRTELQHQKFKMYHKKGPKNN